MVKRTQPDYFLKGRVLSKLNSNTLSPEIFDVLVIGAGVVGCAMARRYALEGAKVAIIEKASDILDGASKANSAILHTGFDAPEGSLEQACIQAGYDEYLHIHKQLSLPLERTGAYVVAWTAEQESKLNSIVAQAHINGVTDARIVSQAQLQRKEPHLSHQALAAVEIPGESIIDPWTSPYAYIMQAVVEGAKVYRDCALVGGEFSGEQWQLKTSKGELTAQHVINCAGLYGDQIDQLVLGQSSFTIKPRKGQFVVFDKVASELLNAVILPVPSERSKGIVLFRTVFGNLAVGPTAEEQQSRSDASTDAAALQMLREAAIDKLPQLASVPITATYAGIRPATQFKDYQIQRHKDRNWTTVGGIRSTGLSSALGIAKYVYEQQHGYASQWDKMPLPAMPAIQVLAESGHRDWQKKGYGEIICHCERVTLREIKQALDGELNALSLQGLKRKTRVTMGRCQGFYCSSRIAEITTSHFAQSLSENIAND